MTRALTPFALLLAGVASSALAQTQPGDIPIPATPAIAQAPDPTADGVRTTILPGSQPMPVATPPGAVRAERGNIALNFPAADVAVVARAVLGDLLHANYTLAQGTSGTVSLVTPGPVAKRSLFALFEGALAKAGFAVTPVAGGYEIGPSAGARAPIGPDTVGFGSEIITLRFIAADEVKKVLDPVLPGVVSAAGGGTITISGTTGQRASARDLIHQFDVDWLRNTSFALYVPEKTDARLIVPELDKLINAPDSPTRGLVRLIGMESLNGILAISTQPQYLIDVRRWVEVLDREGESNERRIWVYRVQNGRARDLTKTINAAYGYGSGGNGGNGGGGQDATGPGTTDPFGPDSTPPAPPTASGAPAPAPARAASLGGAAAGGVAAVPVRITADEGNNAVIVFGTAREFAVVEDAMRKLDIAPQQVLIEAAITEVALTDDTSFGIQWNYSNNGSTLGFSQGTTATPTQVFPGFSYAYTGPSITATLNALQQHSKLKVVSAPKLLVLNNQTAALQVGDEVPISTGTATGLQSSTSAIVSTIEYKDTGVILKITPRVNASGMVQLDVSQEVSEISTANASAATQSQSPTISTRRIATTVSVRDGEVIALGGLFRDSRTVTRNGIPILSQIPVLGAAFGNHGYNDQRTELIVILKPHVISTPDDARAATDELRAKIRTLEPFRSTGQIP